MLKNMIYYAKCNQAINSILLSIIAKQNEDLFNMSVNGFFKNIGDILEHTYIGDIRWLNDFRSIKSFTFSNDSLFNDLPVFGNRYINNIEIFKTKREYLDNIFIKLVNEITENDLNKAIGRTNRKGQKNNVIFWKALIHVFNHQTHHRGQISQILDELKIENDYSNMIYVKDE